ncbi:hypothetical protein JAAARDRAFT_195693 [Jaapia argillacea MUCL 33604]|uniref:Uncharacterized protein n=1 Tax=Jaapia argillacea MUCL 33604 TaxID=933084 RepID=A0A067PZW6_9AGAM|nr:hypothetical protein JAAARDRAFT_195693 [Jaapia argillacea MUCL 33604]
MLRLVTPDPLIPIASWNFQCELLHKQMFFVVRLWRTPSSTRFDEKDDGIPILPNTDEYSGEFIFRRPEKLGDDEVGRNLDDICRGALAVGVLRLYRGLCHLRAKIALYENVVVDDGLAVRTPLTTNAFKRGDVVSPFYDK